jgi:2-dehydro-3-deoxyphosphogluconate aldolase/(4S)-4-hydroxy-2-oxoglutarate aldolase
MTLPADIDPILTRQAVIPVVTINDAAMAVPLAETLHAAGLSVIEITLRTPAALEALRLLARMPGVIAGAGTVLNRDDAERAGMAGAQFLVSPGLTDTVVKAASKMRLPILPGVATASEVMMGLDMGLTRFKFFPAEQAGGRAMLEALHGPFPNAKFCPTGGIGVDLAPAYLALPNVLCVGGGWVAPKDQIGHHGWDSVRANAQKAAVMKAHGA